MQTNKRLGFGLKTAYIAVVYFDRFFLHRIIDVRKKIIFSFVFPFIFVFYVICLSYKFFFTERQSLGCAAAEHCMSFSSRKNGGKQSHYLNRFSIRGLPIQMRDNTADGASCSSYIAMAHDCYHPFCLSQLFRLEIA
jgi:hypothetical protein